MIRLETITTHTITIDPVRFSQLNNYAVELSVLRLDKIHPVISGNKWFKLSCYLEEAKKQSRKNIVTFGGAWSNHIAATAEACRLYGFSCTGIIRGEKPVQLSATLQNAEAAGMQLIFTDRASYKNKEIPAALQQTDNFIIPEGGHGKLGAEGAAFIPDLYKNGNYTHIICACGTGTMLAGLINGSPVTMQLTGVSVLKNNTDLEASVSNLVPVHHTNYRVFHDYHFGGYAKTDKGLLDFMNRFYAETGISSDFVYTGKLFFAVTDLIQKGIVPAGSRVLAIHSGGLQGNLSLKKGVLIF